MLFAFHAIRHDDISQAEEANLPETMCRLSVGMRSVEELRMLMRTGKDLMLNTPKSFRKILRSALYANLSQVRCGFTWTGVVGSIAGSLKWIEGWAGV